MGIVLAGPARAQSVIGSASTTVYLASNNYPGGNPFTITNATTVAVNGNLAVMGDATQPWTLSNAGNISATSSTAVQLADGGTVSNSGTILSTGTSDFGIRLLGNAGSIDNSGLLSGYTGAGMFGSDAALTNSGIITGTANGLTLNAGGSVSNQGTIEGGENGIYLAGGGGTVSNLGTASYVSGSSHGILIASSGVDVLNDGTIIGNNVYGQPATAIYLTDDGTVTNNSGGSLLAYTDGIALHGTGVVINAGVIDAFGGAGYGVLLNQGTVTNDAGGTIFGTRYGVALQLAGTVINSGSILDNNVGVALENGGSVNNAAGGAIYGAYSAVQVLGAAGDVVNSGSVTGSLGVLLRDGGGVINNSGGAIVAYEQGIAILAPAASISNAGLIRATSTTGISTGVYLPAGGYVANQTGGVIAGNQEAIYVAGNAGTVINSGSLTSANGMAVALLAGGSVSNNADGIIDGGSIGVVLSGQSGIISNFGSIIGHDAYGIRLGHGGTINNGPDGYIHGGYDGIGAYGGDRAVAVTNAAGGTISGVQNGLVLLNAGGNTLANAGTIDGLGIGVEINGGIISNTSTGRISGSNYGIVLTSAATIQNSGAIIQYESGSTAGKAAIAMTNGGDIGNAADGTISGAVSGIAASGNLNIINAGVVSGQSAYGVLLQDGGVVTNLAGGRITGGLYGVEAGDLGAVTIVNNGYIGGGQLAVGHDASGGMTLLNYGTIEGGRYGAWGYDPGSNTLSNAAIIESPRTAVFIGDMSSSTEITGDFSNSGTIDGGMIGIAIGYAGNTLANRGTVTNTGSIYGGTYGVALFAGGTVMNAAGSTITAAQTAIMVTGGAGSVTNAGEITGGDGYSVALRAGGWLSNLAGGTISGGMDGIYAGGGATVSNAGLIADRAAPGHAGVRLGNGATLDNLTGGTISGTTGVLIAGANAILYDAGTIIGSGGNAIEISAAVDPAQLTLTTGAVTTGTIDGGGTDGQVFLAGHNTLTNTIADFGAGSGLTVDTGADWTASGNWTVAQVTNDGTLQPGIPGTPLDLTGNFFNAAGATLQIVVTPTLTSRFIIAGKAQLAGTLSYEFAPGTYSQHEYQVISASGGVTGAFNSVTYNGSVPTALQDQTVNGATTANLLLGTAVDPGQPPDPVVVTPADDSIFADTGQAGAEAARQASTELLDHAARPAPDDVGTACAAAAVAPGATAADGASTAARMTDAIGAALCHAGGWIEATGSAANMDGSAGAAGYDADTGGFLAGIDRQVDGAGGRLGIAVGYDETWLHDGAGGKALLDTTRIGLYGAQPLGRFTLSGDVMAGFGNISTARPTGVGTAQSSHGSMAYAGALQIGTVLDYGDLTLSPAAGLNIASAQNKGFMESGGGVVPEFALTGGGQAFTSVQPFVTLGITRSYLTANGISISPDASVGYDYEAGARGRAVNVTSMDGTVFASGHTNAAPSAAVLAAGIQAGKGEWTLYARYRADLSGNWTSQIGEAGFTMRF